MKAEKMLEKPKTMIKVFVANVDEKVKKGVEKIAQKLRREGIPCQTDLMSRSLTKQLEFINSLGIPYCLIVGERELKKKKFKLKDMRKGTEKTLKFEGIVRLIRGS
jgi:histidyl-tRNA synthetase